MSFDALIKKMHDEFSSDAYGSLRTRIFYVSDKDDYSYDDEQSEVVKMRTAPDPDNTIGKISRAEARFGWLCGMDRDRLVQEPTNYSEIMRNNCVLRKDVYERLYEAKMMLSSG